MPSRRSPVANATKAGAPQPDPHARLFQAKLKPPLDAARVLQRSGLPGAEAIGQARLALFNAPAGFGKTTALCQYERALREAGITTAWITLDAEDDDLARFTPYLRAALRRCVPGDGAASGSESGHSSSIICSR